MQTDACFVSLSRIQEHPSLISRDNITPLRITRVFSVKKKDGLLLEKVGSHRKATLKDTVYFGKNV